MADENDGGAARSEFIGYLEDLKKVIRGLESDLDAYKSHRPDDDDELAQYKRELRVRLDNSRSELESLIRSLS